MSYLAVTIEAILDGLYNLSWSSNSLISVQQLAALPPMNDYRYTVAFIALPRTLLTHIRVIGEGKKLNQRFGRRQHCDI